MTLRLVGKVVVAVSVLAVAGFAVAQTLKGPVSDKPFDEKWAPTKWGANDRDGRLGQSHEELGEHRAGACHDQAEQGHHDRQVLPS